MLVVDTREQRPLFKPSSWVVDEKLDQGDYSIRGFEDRVVIERKGLGDLYGSLGKGRKRFEREIQRIQGYQWWGLLVEGSEKKMYDSIESYSSLHPNSLYHSLASLEVQTQCHIYYARDRRVGKEWVLSRLTRLYRYLREGKI